jgi:hypothetical protein
MSTLPDRSLSDPVPRDDRTQRAEVEVDVAPARDQSMAERGRRLAAVRRSGWAILRARPDFERAVSWRDPRPEHFEKSWSRLMARAKSNQTSQG